MLCVSCAVFSQTLSVNPFHRRNRGKRLTDSQDSGETKRISAAKLKGLEMYIYIYIYIYIYDERLGAKLRVIESMRPL